MLLVSDHRLYMRADCEPDVPEGTSSVPGLTSQVIETRQNLQRIWAESRNKASGHTCTLDCLVQPTIASVNRCLRGLSLPMFYGLNQFHFQLWGFELPTTASGRKLKRSPADWWRTVGNANIAQLRQFSITGRAHQSAATYGGVMVMYHAKHGFRGKTVLDYEWRSRDGSEEEQKQLQRLLASLNGKSLSVEVIEGVVIRLETRNTKYLRAHSIVEINESGMGGT